MKVRTAVKRICPSCKLVRRGRKQFVICPTNARHKQRQGFSTLAGALAPVGAAPAPSAALLLAGAVADLEALTFDALGDEDL